MFAIDMLEGWTITSLENIENYDKATGDYINTLDELKSITIANTEDSSDVTGKGGQALFTIKKNKAVTGSGTSGYISGSLLTLQTGSEGVTGLIKFRKHQRFTVARGATTVITEQTASGTEGAEIISLIATVDDAIESTKFTQATTADADKFSYAPATKTITLPTGLFSTKGGVIDVVYDYEKNGASISNNADTYGKTTHSFINCLGKNKCDEIYCIQIEIPRCDWDANFNFELGGDGVEHPFNFKSLKDTCSGDANFWDFKIYKE